MASIFKFFICVLLTLTTFSCNISEIETELDIPYKADFLVLHGFICQGEGIRLILQKTVPHSCNDCSDSVSNAVVSLYENGAYLFDLNTDDGYWYYSPLSFSPNVGSQYHIKAEADKMVTAISSAVNIMQKVPIDTAYIEATENPYKVKVHYRFTDIPFERNQYLVRILADGEDEFMWGDPFNFDKVIGDEVSINGNIEGVSILFFNSDLDEISVLLYHLSPLLVQYLYSRQANMFSEEDPFIEYPVPVFSNISNGYGFFESYSKDTYIIRL
jgi:hypothetical protein